MHRLSCSQTPLPHHYGYRCRGKWRTLLLFLTFFAFTSLMCRRRRKMLRPRVRSLLDRPPPRCALLLLFLSSDVLAREAKCFQVQLSVRRTSHRVHSRPLAQARVVLIRSNTTRHPKLIREHASKQRHALDCEAYEKSLVFAVPTLRSHYFMQASRITRSFFQT